MSDQSASKQQHKLKWILYIELCLLFVVVLTYSTFKFSDYFSQHILKKYFNPPNIRFFTEKGKLRGKYLQALDQPIIKRDSLINWAQLATISVNTLNSSNYQAQLDDAFDRYFTKDGADSLRWALKRQGFTEDILLGKLSVTAVAHGPAIILSEGRLLGRNTWKLQIPILLTTESLGDIKSSQQLITLMIVSVPTNENYQGFGIDSYIARS